MTVLLPQQPGREGFDALGFDPAPGEVGNIETLSTNYTQVSRSLEQAHQALTRIGSSSGIWQGQAADNFRDTVGELPDYLDKAYRSLEFAVATPKGLVTATMVIALHPLQVEDPEAAAADLSGLAAAVREIVQRRAPYAETRVVTLPAGPAVVGVTLGEFRLPPERTGGDADVVVPTYRVQFLIPLPTGEDLFALDVSTTSAYGWPTIARHAVAAAGSVRFDGAG